MTRRSARSIRSLSLSAYLMRAEEKEWGKVQGKEKVLEMD